MLVLFGGGGFLGSHLRDCAKAELIPTTIITRKPHLDDTECGNSSSKYVVTNTPCAIKAISQAKTLVYLASNSKPKSDLSNSRASMLEDVNTLMEFVENLLEVNPQCSFIYLSSGGQIYGPNHSEPISESSVLDPITPYALNKCFAECYLTYVANSKNLKLKILRLANPIGRWQLGTAHGLVSYTINAVRTDYPLTIFGDGKNIRDYFDADEFSKFICSLHTKNDANSGVFNIGTSIGYGEIDVVNRIEKSLGLKVDLKFSPARTFDLRYSVLNVEKAKSILGWNPKIRIEESITKISNAVSERFEGR